MIPCEDLARADALYSKRKSKMIAEAINGLRKGWQEFWNEFRHFSSQSLAEWRIFCSYYYQLVAFLGEEGADEIEAEVVATFCAEKIAQGVDPEVCNVFAYGTDEERDSYPIISNHPECNAEAADAAAMAAWIADRKRQKNQAAWIAEQKAAK